MNFRVLRYFLAVASNLSFTHAAENLHISQSTLSQQIQQLEDYYGVKLFDRSGKSITLTAAGLEFQDWAAQLLSEQDALQDRLHQIADGKQTAAYPLRITFDVHMVQDQELYHSLLDALDRLKQELQDRIIVKLSFSTVDLDDRNTDINKVLDESQTDFWILGTENPLQHTGLTFLPLCRDQFVVMMSQRHPLYRPDLGIDDIPNIMSASTLYMIQNRSRYLRKVIDQLPGGQHISPILRFEPSAEAIRLYVALGMGISLVPHNNRDPNLDTDHICIPVPNASFHTYAGFRKETANPLPALLFQQLQVALAHRQRT